MTTAEGTSSTPGKVSALEHAENGEPDLGTSTAEISAKYGHSPFMDLWMFDQRGA